MCVPKVQGVGDFEVFFRTKNLFTWVLVRKFKIQVQDLSDLNYFSLKRNLGDVQRNVCTN